MAQIAGTHWGRMGRLHSFAASGPGSNFSSVHPLRTVQQVRQVEAQQRRFHSWFLYVYTYMCACIYIYTHTYLHSLKVKSKLGSEMLPVCVPISPFSSSLAIISSSTLSQFPHVGKCLLPSPGGLQYRVHILTGLEGKWESQVTTSQCLINQSCRERRRTLHFPMGSYPEGTAELLGLVKRFYLHGFSTQSWKT